jgi:hypothetical protein
MKTGFTRKSLATRLRDRLDADPSVSEWRIENAGPATPLRYVLTHKLEGQVVASPGTLAGRYGEPILTPVQPLT